VDRKSSLSARCCVTALPATSASVSGRPLQSDRSQGPPTSRNGRRRLRTSGRRVGQHDQGPEQARPWYEQAIDEKRQGDIHGRVNHDSLGAILRSIARFARETGDPRAQLEAEAQRDLTPGS